MVDARGHGRSSGPETGYSQALLTEDVAGLIRELGLQHPSLFGYSNGAFHFMHHEMQGEQFDRFINVVRAFLDRCLD